MTLERREAIAFVLGSLVTLLVTGLVAFGCRELPWPTLQLGPREQRSCVSWGVLTIDGQEVTRWRLLGDGAAW